ncbi:MAG: c-type cytochrome [Leptospirillia bacterium]
MTLRTLLCALVSMTLWAAPAAADVAEGQRLYKEKNCAVCHTIGEEGGEVGPNLSAEGAAGRDRDWHIRHLLDPAGVVPGSIMPVWVENAEEAGHLADYLLSLMPSAAEQAEAAAVAALAAPPPAPDSAAGRGRKLYMESGCGGCHKIGGNGGSFGPDLTFEGDVAGHDLDWHIAHFANPAQVTPGSVMPPVALSEDALADLAAYMVSLKRSAAPAAPAAAASPVPAPPPSGPVVAAAGVSDAERGRTLFTIKGCVGCHVIRGTGGSLGPDLTFEGEVKGHDLAWHQAHFANPSQVVPGSAMPPFDLPPNESRALAAYMLSLVRMPEDRTLSPALATRLKEAHDRLEAARARIDHAAREGRNVDDLNLLLSEGWTHVGTVEGMVRRELVTGVEREIEAAEGRASELELALLAFESELDLRIAEMALVVVMLLIGCGLLLRKIRLLNEEWHEQERERAAKPKKGRVPWRPDPEAGA